MYSMQLVSEARHTPICRDAKSKNKNKAVRAVSLINKSEKIG